MKPKTIYSLHLQIIYNNDLNLNINPLICPLFTNQRWYAQNNFQQIKTGNKRNNQFEQDNNITKEHDSIALRQKNEIDRKQELTIAQANKNREAILHTKQKISGENNLDSETNQIKLINLIAKQLYRMYGNKFEQNIGKEQQKEVAIYFAQTALPFIKQLIKLQNKKYGRKENSFSEEFSTKMINIIVKEIINGKQSIVKGGELVYWDKITKETIDKHAEEN